MLEDQDWIDRRAIVDAANAKGAQLCYYDHLPIDKWMPPFDTEQKVKQYIRDFDVMAEKFLGPY